MKILFFGTSSFAVCILKHLMDSEYETVGVVTQADKPKGRGRKVVSPPVKEPAENAGISIFQPVSCKNPDFISTVRSLEPDFLVVAAYGRILPENILCLPRQAPINVHASLLPGYRGAAPIQWAIINGEGLTGVSTMVMDKGMDTGDVLLTAETQIEEKETADSLHDRLADLGGALLIQTLDRWVEGSLIRHPQDHLKATYAPSLKKENGHIRWEDSAQIIDRKVRGMTPWPGTYAILGGKRIKVLEVDVSNQVSSASPGTVIQADGDRLEVSCSGGVLAIQRLQVEGKKPVPAKDFLGGLRRSIKGEIFV